MKSNILKTLIFICLASTLLISCSKDDDNDLQVNNSYVTTSFGSSAIILPIYDDMSFIDLSRGVVSREWKFPDGTLNTDSLPITSSTDEVVKVMFTKPGTYNVSIHQVYEDNVYLTLQKMDSNILDQEISVEVLDSIRALFTANEITDPKDLTIASNANNKIEAGHEVQFTSTATGKPTSNEWTITKDDNIVYKLTGENPVFKFSATGKYSVTYFCSSSFGKSSSTYENIIEVIPSDDPVTLDHMARSADNQINLTFSRSMNDVSTCDVAAFTLNVINGSHTVNVAVESMSYSDNVVTLKLDGPIYNSDIITLTYDSTIGDLATLDGMKVDSFSDMPMTDFNLPSILEDTDYDFGFEQFGADAWVSDGWGGFNDFSLSTSTSIVHSGKQSLKITMNAGSGAIFHQAKNGSAVEFNCVKGQKYSLGMWVYLENMGSGNNPSFHTYQAIATDWGSIQHELTNEDVGKWIHLTEEITINSDHNYFWLRPNGNEGEVNMYLDDITLIPIETRKF